MTVLTTVFIWGNSFQNSEDSNAVSSVVVETMEKITESEAADTKLNIFVRKAAHLLEFALLGALLAMIKAISGRFSCFAVLFVSLAVAVADEMIQHFNGRTDSVTDIALDFGGALCGIAIIVLAAAVRRRTKTASKKT